MARKCQGCGVEIEDCDICGTASTDETCDWCETCTNGWTLDRAAQVASAHVEDDPTEEPF